MEHRNCQNCKQSFTIEPDDFSFYEKMKVPAPTWCPECRLQRRFSFLSWHTLYKRSCDSCDTGMVSVHHAGKPFHVYCPVCWWSDSWDGTEYAQSYDPSRPFFEQMIELKNKSSFMGLENMHASLENTPYSNATAYQKNCYMVFHSDYGERNAYLFFSAYATDCIDCYRVNTSELCYECVGLNKCYGCVYSEELDSCTNVSFSRACYGCTDCFGCINLRNKSNCIFNVQYSKEEYKQKMQEYNLATREGIASAIKMSRTFWMDYPRRSMLGNSLNVQATGDMVYESKNVTDGYMVTSAEDSKYVQFISLAPTRDCYDYTVWGNGAERVYECLTVGEGAYNDKFCAQCWPNAIDNEYCLYTIQSKNCFGCVNLKRKEYCILNKQYTKEEYFALRDQIIADMTNNPYHDSLGRAWRYGEFLPFELSPYAYNESVASDFYPLNKEEAGALGVSWYESMESFHKASCTVEQLPDPISEVTDTVLGEIIECTSCGNGYRVSDMELLFLRKMNIPLPVHCWKCRQKRRLESVSKPKFYDRVCGKCGAGIRTSYAPDRPEIVYCEKCYQSEVI